MKKRLCALLGLLLFIPAINAQLVVPTHATKDCSLLYDFNGDYFEKYISIKNNTQLGIVGISTVPNTYEVTYKQSRYYIHKNFIIANDIEKFNKLYKDSIIVVEQMRNDSIRKAKPKGLIATIMSEFEKTNNKNLSQQEKDSLNKELSIQRSAANAFVSEKLDSLIKIGRPILVNKLNISYPNSAGGVDLYIKLTNIRKSDIKYIYVTGYPVNAVNDRCYCLIRKYSSTTGKGVGPIKYLEQTSYNFDNTWYNETIDKFIPENIKIQYMDGKVYTLNRMEIDKALTCPDYIDFLNRQLKRYKAIE